MSAAAAVSCSYKTILRPRNNVSRRRIVVKEYYSETERFQCALENSGAGTVQQAVARIVACAHDFFILFFAHFYFPASGQAVVTVSSLLPPGSCLQFLSRIGFSNPTARQKSPPIYGMHSGGIRTHETDLYEARG